MKYKIINIDVFKEQVLVFIGTQTEFMKLLKKYTIKCGDTTTEVEDVLLAIKEQFAEREGVICNAVTLEVCGAIVIYSNTPISDETLVHESVHAAKMVLNQVCAPIEKSDEPYAYLVEYIYSQAKELCATSCEVDVQLQS